MGRGPVAAWSVRSVGQPLLHREPAWLLRGTRSASRRSPPLDRPRVLRVGQRVRPIRGHRVLGLHGRPVHERTGQAPVWSNSGRRVSRRYHRLRHNRGPGRPHQPFLSPPHRLRPARDRVPGGPAAAPPLRSCGKLAAARGRAGFGRGLERDQGRVSLAIPEADSDLHLPHDLRLDRAVLSTSAPHLRRDQRSDGPHGAVREDGPRRERDHARWAGLHRMSSVASAWGGASRSSRSSRRPAS